MTSPEQTQPHRITQRCEHRLLLSGIQRCRQYGPNDCTQRGSTARLTSGRGLTPINPSIADGVGSRPFDRPTLKNLYHDCITSINRRRVFVHCLLPTSQRYILTSSHFKTCIMTVLLASIGAASLLTVSYLLRNVNF